ncbi:MAG: CPBP family intramembrane metalloprotease [Candidatus Lokiarchaeota archaeon]|nr:CPBP family intramembrane metalloprotease [Candidatus Lokiarchaeota archaeon]MBD3200178.1 CPBP family intramembrane metalloprotease [Candidatus Lokiarchaeota archaeon]
MSEKKDDESLVKYCVYCGEKVEKDKVYCPNCGKLVVKPTENKKNLKTKSSDHKSSKSDVASRKCDECGSIIKSPILKQCPICNAKLSVPPKPQPKPSETKSGFIFTDKKLEPEQKFILKKENWSFKEGINVFANSILIYITVSLIIFMISSFIFDQELTAITDIDMNSILIGQIPELLIGVYPLWYIYKNRHSFTKIGFFFESKKLMIAVGLGLVGGLVLYITDLFSNEIILFLYNLGLKDIFDILAYTNAYSSVLQGTNVFYLLLFIVMITIATISSEILFRGTLHNTLKEKLDDDISGRILVILIVALIYSGIYLLFTFPMGLYFIVFYFISNIILGIIYEYNGNIWNSIIANIIYNIVFMIIILYF